MTTTCKVRGAIGRIICCKIRIANALAPVANFVARCLIAKIFFVSGTLKLPSGFLGIGQGNWGNTLTLFEYEYNVPLLSPLWAAYLGTAVEIIAPILLVLGLGARAAAAAILIMTIVIEYTYMHSMEHYYWAAICFMIITYGADKLSLDYVITKKCKPCA